MEKPRGTGKEEDQGNPAVFLFYETIEGGPRNGAVNGNYLMGEEGCVELRNNSKEGSNDRKAFTKQSRLGRGVKKN